MRTIVCNIILIILMIVIGYCLSGTVTDIRYSVSPDGSLSIVRNFDRDEIYICFHPNYTSWYPLTKENNVTQNREVWITHRLTLRIGRSLSRILQIVVTDADRIVYIAIDNKGEIQIGTTEIIVSSGGNQNRSLHYQKLDIDINKAMLVYDIQLGPNIYLTSSSHFVVYNFKTFELYFIDWNDTTNMTYVNNVLILSIIDQTHLLIGIDGFKNFDDNHDCPHCPIIALIEIDFSSSPLDIYIISYEVIIMPNGKFLSHPIEHISMDMNIYGNILIGLPEVDCIVFADLNMRERRLILTNRTFSMETKGYNFGFSVAWLSDQRQFAVNAKNKSFEPISSSQLFIFNFDDEQLWIRSTFPNSQQFVSFYVFPLQFLNIFLLHGTYFGVVAWQKNNGLVILIISSMPGGSGTCDFFEDEQASLPHMFCRRAPCLPGMYKSENASFVPCLSCPEGTKAPTYGSIKCESCLNLVKCPIGSIDERPEYPRITQIVSYPEASDSTAFDDIILSNMFSFECLLISPIFWMFITIGIVSLFLFSVYIIGFCPRLIHYCLGILQAFKHIDLIGEGHLWIGGLVSCGICVLIAFAVLFSLRFINLYPIEQIRQSSLICNPKVYNAKFTSGLQFLALPKSDDELPIFELLNEQPLNLTLDLINTIVHCSNIKIVYRNGAYIHSTPWFECSKDENNVTVSLVIPLPSHVTLTEIRWLEPYGVESVRVCLHGMNKTTIDDRYHLRHLSSCEVFFNSNHSMNSKPEFDIIFTKVINRTEPLENGQLSKYTGLWIPLVNIKDLTTKLIDVPTTNAFFRKYDRSSVITIRQTESQFYIQNKQEPIARKYEVAFHNILFLSVTLELFGLIFLISKLILLPFGRLILNWFKKHSRLDDFLKNIKHRNSQATTDVETTRI